jgi:hypothetical protein
MNIRGNAKMRKSEEKKMSNALLRTKFHPMRGEDLIETNGIPPKIS